MLPWRWSLPRLPLTECRVLACVAVIWSELRVLRVQRYVCESKPLLNRLADRRAAPLLLDANALRRLDVRVDRALCAVGHVRAAIQVGEAVCARRKVVRM